MIEDDGIVVLEFNGEEDKDVLKDLFNNLIFGGEEMKGKKMGTYKHSELEIRKELIKLLNSFEGDITKKDFDEACRIASVNYPYFT